MEVEQPQDWYFTFGCDQKHAGCYTIIHGTYYGARDKMIEKYGREWSMQYPSAEHAGVERWNLKKI